MATKESGQCPKYNYYIWVIIFGMSAMYKTGCEKGSLGYSCQYSNWCHFSKKALNNHFTWLKSWHNNIMSQDLANYINLHFTHLYSYSSWLYYTYSRSPYTYYVYDTLNCRIQRKSGHISEFPSAVQPTYLSRFFPETHHISSVCYIQGNSVLVKAPFLHKLHFMSFINWNFSRFM